MTQAEAETLAVSVRVGDDLLVQQLRSAGCVFAEDEADILLESADGPDELDVLCQRRVAGEPLEQIVGWVDFGALRLKVGPGVFVPRQRSRLIAQLAVDAVVSAESESAVFVEAFAGVAPLAASVARAVPRTHVHVSDVDGEVLRYARQNLENLRSRAGVYRGPSLAAMPDQLRREVDVIAAVPPYAPTTAADLLSRESDHEPPAALFGGVDGLDHVRSLIDQAAEWLTRNGCLLIEMNKRQCPAAVAYAEHVSLAVTRHDGDDGQTAVLGFRAS